MIITIIDQLNIDAAEQKLTDLTDLMIENIRSVISAESAVFNDTVDSFNANIRSNLINETVGESLKDLFTEYDAVAILATDRVTLHERLFDFGDNDDISTSATLQIENAKNLNKIIQTFALSFAYVSSAQVEFNNNEDLLNNVTVLNTQFNKINDGTLDKDTFDQFMQLKTLYLQYLSNLDVADVIVINTNKLTPSTELTYRLFGDFTNLDTIIGLNNQTFTGFLQGDIKVIQQ